MHAVESFIRHVVAGALRPPPRMGLAEWAKRFRVLPNEVSANAGKWDGDLFPFLNEIMDCLCPWHPAETVTFCKSAQVGGSEVGMNWLFAIIDLWPAPTLIVHPSIDSARAWVNEKMTPSIQAVEVIRRKVVEQRSRKSGSTTLFKSFAGGYLVMAGSNSAASISQKSVRFVVKEEWDRWAWDVDGQGDPDRLVDARQISYHQTGKAKQYRASTPTNMGDSRVWRSFEEGDQRYYEVPCPHCDEYQVLEFFPDAQKKGGVVFNRTAPYQATYVCRHCGTHIEHYHKREMLSKGRWVARFPDQGRQPSFFVNAIYSPVTTWDKMAEAFLSSKDDPQALKTFYNLWLGLPWKEKGEAPDWQRLMLRREDYKLGHIPLGGLLITCAADVQKDGIYYETVAWGEGKTSWSIDIGFLPGETDDARQGAWRALDEVHRRTYTDGFGNHRGIDLFGVDSGYNTHSVYEWCRQRMNARALDGRPGWYHPPFGTPKKQDVNFAGRKLSKGINLWPVGTWMLKGDLYGCLRKEWLGDISQPIPMGYCHFSKEHDQGYFQQLTAEHVAEREHGGRIVREWKATGPNHYHDCRIYNMALAEMLQISRMTEDEWTELRRLREVSANDRQRELFHPLNEKNASEKGGYIDAPDNWIG